ncbi:hypothetical protein [Clostridium massiliamazoniense]|uniref:hypothetical protein n=1 Tax=Clostridium massiliamazoniense TaxID=1347366 RepID=UPI0006D8299B|nr:hypothetical protein [Clostridium massiliamazoniense]
MGSKLKGNMLLNSLDSLQQFHRIHNCNYKEFDVNISVISNSNGKSILSKQVPVQVAFDNETQFIDIMWEDVGMKNYKSKRLFGRYNPNFNEMILDENNNSLEIKSIDSDKRVVIHWE